MCGRFFIDEKSLIKLLKNIYTQEDGMGSFNFNSDIYPTNKAPIITIKNSKLTLSTMKWGYPHYKNNSVIINARAETVLEKEIFSIGIRKNRIAIPATHFYEWNQNKEKFTLSRVDGDILYMAGFFDSFKGEDRFIILTTNSNDSMMKIHHRMPLIIDKNQVKDWIEDDNKAEEILSQIPRALKAHSEIEQQSMF